MAHFERTRPSAWRWRPDWFEHVNRQTLRQDLFAGLTGATIVLPQAVAFAVIAGLPPEHGFYTAMIPPIFASLSGLYEVGDPEFIRAAIVLSLMVGVIQIGFAAFRLGAVVNFVSHSVMTGFITGASLLILLSQFRYVFGIDLPRPEHLSDLFAYVPVPAMGGTIIVVALKLINLREIMHFFRVSKSEGGIFIITFASSLAISLEFAIYCGVIISVVLFLNRAAHPRLSVGVPFPFRGRRSFRPVKDVDGPVCPQLIVVGLDGPLFFGSVDVIRREFRRIEGEYADETHMIFNMRGVGQIDLPAAELLIEEAKRRIARGGRLYVQTKIPPTIRQMQKYGVTGHIGGGKVHLYKGDAISFAIGELRHDICQACDVRLWHDCPTFPQPHPDADRASPEDRTERQD